jgi:hypothetical protein
MTKHSSYKIVQFVDEISAEMPLEGRVSLANMKNKDIDFCKAYLIYIYRVRFIPMMRTIRILCMNSGIEFEKHTVGGL